jgi:hypothetical protein
MNVLVNFVSLESLLALSNDIKAIQTIKVDIICLQDTEISNLAKENITLIMKRFTFDETQTLESS